MAKSRDRLWSPDEVRAESRDRPYEIRGPFARRSPSITGGIFYTPFWWGATPTGAARGGGGRNPRLTPAANFGRGRGRESVLPSWYPRKPLRDITAIMRAIERRRPRLREREGLQIDSPITQNVLVHSETASGAQIEHDLPKTLLVVTSQKKLLNCIDTVGNLVMEEFQKLKGTPSAKKVERQKKVRTLMSMR